MRYAKVSVLIGQMLGTYLNDYIASKSIKRNKGVFEAESRLWYGLPHVPFEMLTNALNRMCYISLPFYIAGLIISGFAFQNKLPIVAVVFGWGIREVAVMTTTVAVCECRTCSSHRLVLIYLLLIPIRRLRKQLFSSP